MRHDDNNNNTDNDTDNDDDMAVAVVYPPLGEGSVRCLCRVLCDPLVSHITHVLVFFAVFLLATANELSASISSAEEEEEEEAAAAVMLVMESPPSRDDDASRVPGTVHPAMHLWSYRATGWLRAGGERMKMGQKQQQQQKRQGGKPRESSSENIANEDIANSAVITAADEGLLVALLVNAVCFDEHTSPSGAVCRVW
ncbi:unnamed protein product [Lampetra planeri]